MNLLTQRNEPHMNKIVLLIVPLHCEHFQMAITAVHRESRFKYIYIFLLA